MSIYPQLFFEFKAIMLFSRPMGLHSIPTPPPPPNPLIMSIIQLWVGKMGGTLSLMRLICGPRGGGGGETGGVSMHSSYVEQQGVERTARVSVGGSVVS